MRNKKRSARSAFLGLAALLGALVLSCSDDMWSPTSTGDPSNSGGRRDVDVHSLWISGFYHLFPHGAPPDAPTGTVVYVRERDANGGPVEDLVVYANDRRLSYDAAWGAYVGGVPEAIPGESIKISVGDGRDAVSASAPLPGAPSELFLHRESALWEPSPPWAGNTLVWNNPAIRGSSIVVFLYERIPTGRYLVHWLSTDASESTRVRIYNHEVYYGGMGTGIVALVCHANGAVFPSNPAGSGIQALAGVWGEWDFASAP